MDHDSLERIEPKISTDLAVEVALLHPMVAHQAQASSHSVITADRHSSVASSAKIFCREKAEVGRRRDRPGLHDAIDEPVRRFRLIGFGATRNAAMAMAEKMNGGATES